MEDESTEEATEQSPAEEAPEHVGGDLQKPDTLRQDRKRRHTFASLFRDSPFLIASFLLHMVILLLLAFITAQEPREARQRIRLTMDEIEVIEELEMEPMIRERDFAHGTAGERAAGFAGEGTGEGLQDALGGIEEARAPNVDILGMRTAVGTGSTTQFQGHTEDGFSLAAADDGTIEGAADQFSIVTINSAERGRTLVVFVIDRTRSVVYLNLPVLIDRIDSYFEAMQRNLRSDLQDNIRWAVVSYGQDVHFISRPTDDIEKLKDGLRDIRICPSGEQRIGSALEMIMDEYSESGYKNMLIAAMTDGYGSDLRDASFLEGLIRRLRDARTTFFVFGHESAFAHESKLKSLVLDPEVLQPEDLAEVRGFEGEEISDWVLAGAESPAPELWGASGDRAGVLANIPSGFPMYALNRIVLATGGIYFLLEDESDYDVEKLYALYKPSVASIFEYNRQREEDELMRALAYIWKRIDEFDIRREQDFDMRDNAEIRRQIENAKRGRSYFTEGAQDLRRLMDEYDFSRQRQPQRWQAHAQVTLAEMLRLRFTLGQYAAALENAWERNRYTVPRGKRYVMRMGSEDDMADDRRVAMEYARTREYIKSIKEQHRGTPWEILAARIIDQFAPFRCSIEDIPPPRQDRRGPARSGGNGAGTGVRVRPPQLRL